MAGFGAVATADPDLVEWVVRLGDEEATVQVRKLLDTPLIMAGAMWAELVEWARRSMLRPDGPLASPEDFAIPICCRTGPEVLDILHDHHSRWKANQEATS